VVEASVDGDLVLAPDLALGRQVIFSVEQRAWQRSRVISGLMRRFMR